MSEALDPRVAAREAAAVMPTYRRMPVELVRGEGAHLFDPAGRRYVDCIAGISMANVGHCHPDVVEAIRTQAGTLINTSNLFYTEPGIALAEWLRDHTIGGKVFFCNSGAEASEAALKLARRHAGPGRDEVVALRDGFHGRTFGALSLTGQPDKQEPFRPLVPTVRHVSRDDPAELDDAISERTAAVFLEVIQGEIGVQPVAPDVLSRARELCDRFGALLIVDEIQTGLSRTGPLLASSEAGLAPDVVLLAKSLGGGVPIGAVVATPEVSDALQPGDHGSTFAASPLACAAGLAACRVLADPVLQDEVRRLGAILLDGLVSLVDSGVALEARGRGLMCAVEFPEPVAADVVTGLMRAGFLANNTSAYTVRFLPPLVIAEEDVRELTGALAAVCAAL